MSRAVWTALTDAQLLTQCEVDTYRASGPGGQKRNKTSSAVRIRHGPSGLLVIAEESRSQHENRAKALQRLRAAFFLQLRDELDPVELEAAAVQARPEWTQVLDRTGRIHVAGKDPRFLPAAGLVLDVLAALQARVSDAAQALGVGTGQLIDFLQTSPKVWEQANHLRAHHGQKLLRDS